MPKIKTHRGAAKRFGVTGSGKLKFNQAKRRHILTKKTSKLKREMRRPGIVADADRKAILKMLPNL